MKRKVREDRLNLRRPAVRPERWVVGDGCINFVFYRSQYRHMLRYVALLRYNQPVCYVTVSPCVILLSFPLLFYSHVLFLFFIRRSLF